MHAGKHAEAKRGIIYNFCCKCTEIMSVKERVTKKMPTHLACRRNERCPDHPGRNHHSGMDVTRTHSHLSHSVALWSPVCSYKQTSPVCWHRCHRAHTAILAHTRLCPHCSPPPCNHWHRSKCKSHWWGLCRRSHQHGMGSMCRHHPDGTAVLWHTDKYCWIYLAHTGSSCNCSLHTALSGRWFTTVW